MSTDRSGAAGPISDDAAAAPEPPAKSAYASTLNALHDMQGTLHYAARRGVLADAERIIVQLEQEAIESGALRAAMARAATGAEPSRLPLMSQAFRTTVVGGGSYRMVFNFPTIEALHAADDEWIANARASLSPQPSQAAAEPVERTRIRGDTTEYDDALSDRSFAAGIVTGCNFAVGEDAVGRNALIERLQRDYLPVLRAGPKLSEAEETCRAEDAAAAQPSPVAQGAEPSEGLVDFMHGVLAGIKAAPYLDKEEARSHARTVAGYIVKYHADALTRPLVAAVPEPDKVREAAISLLAALTTNETNTGYVYMRGRIDQLCRQLRAALNAVPAPAEPKEGSK